MSRPRRFKKTVVRLDWSKSCQYIGALNAVIEGLEGNPRPYDWRNIARELRKLERAINAASRKTLREAIPAAFPDPPP